jgi:hypothetical protein
MTFTSFSLFNQSLIIMIVHSNNQSDDVRVSLDIDFICHEFQIHLLITFDHDLGHLNPHMPLKFSTALWALYPSFQDVTTTTASEHCFF